MEQVLSWPVGGIGWDEDINDAYNTLEAGLEGSKYPLPFLDN